MKKKLLLSLLCASITVFVSHTRAQIIPSYVPSSGLVAYYPLDGTALDLTLNANNGTLNGCTAVLDRYGKVNGAYSFNGTSDYISVPNSTNLNPGSAITISAWIKADAFGINSYDNTIVGKDNWAGGNSGYALRCGDGGKLSFNIAKGVSTWSESVTFLPLLSTSDWFFVTGVYDGAMISTYVNGLLIDSKPSTGALISSTVALLIGSCPGPSAPRYFNGKIDEVGIWSRALTQLEITTLYIGALPPPSCLPAYVPTLSLSGWWPFCGNADDLSSNGNHGSINNTTLTADRNGVPNSAYDFNGSSSYITVSDDNTLDLKDNYTLAAWFKSSSAQSSALQTIFGKGRAAAATGYALNFTNGASDAVSALASDGGTYNGTLTANVIGNSIWHHVAVTYNGSVMNLYVDGVSSATAAATYSLQNSTESLFIGKELSSLPRLFTGKIDDLGIWTRALSSDEVLSLFSGAIINTTGIKEAQLEQKLQIYPNPAANELCLRSVKSLLGSTYVIRDLSGRMILKGSINAQEEKIQIQNLESGIYFVDLPGQAQASLKFVKE